MLCDRRRNKGGRWGPKYSKAPVVFYNFIYFLHLLASQIFKKFFIIFQNFICILHMAPPKYSKNFYIFQNSIYALHIAPRRNIFIIGAFPSKIFKSAHIFETSYYPCLWLLGRPCPCPWLRLNSKELMVKHALLEEHKSND